MEYAQGHGTLGPLLRAERYDGRVQHLAVDDDDAQASGAGMRKVRLEVVVRHLSDLDEVVESMANRPEVSAVRVAGGEAP